MNSTLVSAGNQCSVEIAADAFIEVGVERFRCTRVSCRQNSHLVRYDLVWGERLSDLLGLSLLRVGGDVTGERDNTLVAILLYGDIFEPGLRKRFADAIGHCRGLGRVRATGEQPYGKKGYCGCCFGCDPEHIAL